MNYYELLGVNSDATSVEIKKSYRKLAMQWHPDRNQNSKEAEEKFKEIKEAYETLSNDSARFWYDRELSETNPHFEDSNDHYSNTSNEEQFSSSSSSYEEGNEPFDSEDDNSEEIPEELKIWKAKYPFSEIYQYDLHIPFEDSITGGDFSIKYKIENKGFINLSINVPPYTQNGSVLDLVLTKEDILIVKLIIDDNPNKHLDIHSKIDLDIFTALNGTEIDLATTAGVHHIVIPPLTQNGEIFTFLGLGLKRDIFSGNLYVAVNVYYPESITDTQKELLSELSEIQSFRDLNPFYKIYFFIKEFFYFFNHPKKK